MSLCCFPSCPCTLASHPDCSRLSVFFFCQLYFLLHHLATLFITWSDPALWFCVAQTLFPYSCGSYDVITCVLPGRLLGLLTTFFMCVSRCPPSFIKSCVDCFRVTASLPLVTLNSSTIEVNVSFSWLVLPYSPILVKLGGTLSHLHRCRLITRSNPSTVDVTISYSIMGHKSMGNRPCWHNHTLNLPGSTVFSISFNPPWNCSWLTTL